MTLLPLQLRVATVADLDAIVALDRSTENAPHWPLSAYAVITEDGAESFGAPRRCLFVAHRNGLLVGFAVGLLHSGAQAGNSAELESVVVASAARRAGIGGSLCNAVFDRSRAHGATEVMLEVRAASVGANALYQRLGFVQIGRRPRYYRDPEDDALILRLSFEGSNPEIQNVP